ncbi:tyrosine-type recombinase/integrase [Vagococcus entomophilus]|uniref:Site-specific integrase n=1 Tax=Vagococcus entomophilus TaxID=1160095 RepID=A0A430AK80_9ENTE|nr:site-specific integrase [Vagococcus entomophilus]RSU08478.1 site-specific integrase [Vagococcus entomophilus]
MATIQKYSKKDGSKAYMFKAYLGIDPLTSKKKYTTRRGFKTKKEAKIALARLETEIDRNGISTTDSHVTFKEIYELWFEQYRNTVKESTLYVQKSAMKNNILPRFGNLKIAKITTVYCQKQVNYWYENYKRYPNLIGLTSKVFDYAIKLNKLQTNPMLNVIRPKVKEKIDQKKFVSTFYSKEQLKVFLEKLEKQSDLSIFLMFRILAFTGLRKGELQALRWKDIDFDKETLSINQTVAKNRYGKNHFQTPKTVASMRTITLDSKTLAYLKRLKLEQRKKFLMIGINVKKEEQLIFSNRKNEAYHVGYLNVFLNKFLEKNKLDKISVHGFRHTHCSLLFESGASIKEVQDRLGHTDIKTTMDIYTHVTEKAKEETAQKFASYINF